MRFRNLFFIVLFMTVCTTIFALPFNKQLKADELQKLNAGETVIRNIDYAKYMSIQPGVNSRCDELIAMVKGFNPKYLGEVIQVKPYTGNEDLPSRIEALLNNIDSYTDIPYYSEHSGKWFKLYDEAETVSTVKNGNVTTIMTNLIMDPCGLVEEQIDVINEGNMLYYTAFNKNSLSFKEFSNLLGPEKLKIGIVVFRYEDKWIIYGVGGVNAPHIPFFTDRIRIAFINRICSFCDYIFKML